MPVESSVSPIHHQFYAKIEQRQQVPILNALSQETSYLQQNFSKYVLYIIRVAFSISDEQLYFLPKLSKAWYRAPLLAAVAAVHMGYFQPLLPLSHLSRFTAPSLCHVTLLILSS